MAQGMSYWVYSDLFEEPGPPDRPFHGGFGLLNREGIRKPAYFAYKYLHALRGNAIPVEDAQAMAASDGATIAALVWDFQQPRQDLSNRSFYSRIVPADRAAPLALHLRGLKSGKYRMEVHRVGLNANDAYSAYIDMGAPKSLSAEQIERLRGLTADMPESNRTLSVRKSGTLDIRVPMRGNDVVLVTLQPMTKCWQTDYDRDAWRGTRTGSAKAGSARRDAWNTTVNECD